MATKEQLDRQREAREAYEREQKIRIAQKEAREAYEREQRIRMAQKELDKQKKTTNLLDEGTDTLTIINKDTGKIVRQGTTGGSGSRGGGGTGLPSVTGEGQISQITQQDIEKITNSQPSKTLNLQQEIQLRNQLSKSIQEASFDPRFGFDSKTLSNASKFLDIPQNKRSPQMQADINYAYSVTPAQKNYQLQQELRKTILEKPNQFNQPKTQITGSLRNKRGNILERLGKTSEEAEKNISEGKLSGGLQKEGQILQNIGKEIYNQKPRIPFLFNNSSDARIYQRAQLLTPAKENLSSFLTFLTFPSKLGGSIISGIGQTVETGGNIIELASKRKTWEDAGNAAVGAGKYLIDVGRTADISVYEKDLKGHKIKLPIPIITPSEKVKQDIGKATVLIGDTATGVVQEFTTSPIKATGELIGSGVVIGGATSLANKMIGFGKAGIATIKGGKYIPKEQIVEMNQTYKKGTPKSTIKEWTESKNPKQIFHATTADIFKGKQKGVLKAPKKMPWTDPRGTFGSTGTLNEVYLRLSGQPYNWKPRIPFVNMPTPAKPQALRLIGTTKPQRLTKLGKLKNLEQAKKLFETAKTSKNIPYTSPANELKIKFENEVMFRDLTNITKKGIKGTHDFTFIKGTFVETPRVRVMPSKPTKLIKKPVMPVKEKISKVIKPKKEVSLLRALEQSRAPGTFYNPVPLIRTSLSNIKSTNTSRIVSRKASVSSSRSSTRPSLLTSFSMSSPSTSRTITSPSTSRTITSPSTSRTITSPSTSRTITSPSTSRTISRPSSSTTSTSGSSSLSRPRPLRTSTRVTPGITSSILITKNKIKSSSRNNRTQTPTYDVYVRKTLPGTKKVAPQLVARNVPLNTGINEGTRIASRYTQRTVQLKRTGYTSQPDEVLNRQRLMQYRGFKPTSKIKRQTINLVEKPKYAIDSYEEKQGIPYKGQQVRKKQAFIKKLRLI